MMMINCFSQEAEKERKVSIGLHGGPAMSTIYGSSSISKISPLIGFVVGFNSEFNIRPRFHLDININYERKGYSYNFLVYDPNFMPIKEITIREKHNYITLPVMAKLVLVNKKIKLYANIGAYAGYFFNLNYASPGTATYLGQTYNGKPNGESYHLIDVGVITGLGFAAPLGNHMQLSFELRNNLGLNTIAKSGKSKNESLALLLGLAYKI